MPLADRSVKARHIDFGAVRPEHLAVGTFHTMLPSAAITDTTQWLTHTTKDVHVPTQRCTLIVPITLAVKHSVANAKFGYGLWIYDMDTGSPTNVVVAWQMGGDSTRGLVLPVAGEYHPFIPTAHISFDTDHLNRAGGQKRLSFMVRSWTAGTLTLGDPDLDTNAAHIALLGK